MGSVGVVSGATWTLPMEALCGAQAAVGCEGRGRLRPDPYEQDVRNRTMLRYLCVPCADNVAGDV
jgi:hypothetical protein